MGNYTLADYERDRKKAAATVSNQLSGTLTGGSIIANLRPNYSNGGYVPYVEGLSNGNVTPNVPTPVTPSTPGFNQGTRPTTGSAAPSTNPSTVTPVGNAGSVQPVISNGAGTESGTSVGTESGEETGLTQQQVNSAIVTSDTKAKADNVLQELYDMLNKGFTYNEKDSPLYAILQQQAAKEARIASGRAYSRAVANAGGFGSSYATLAAEEASRQVMEGWNDNQLALYQAAQEEWNNKFSSKVDMYNFLNAQYQQELTEKNAADSLFTSAVSALRSSYGITYDEAAMTADLKAMGLTDEQIKSALENQKQYSEAMKNSSITAQSAIATLGDRYQDYEFNEDEMRLYLKGLNYSETAINEAITYWSQFSSAARSSKFTTQAAMAALGEKYKEDEYDEAGMRAYLETFTYFSDEVINEALAKWKKQYDEAVKAGKPSQGASDALNYILSMGEEGWNGSNEEEIRAILNSQATERGWSSKDVEDAINQLKEIESAKAKDSFESFKQDPTLIGAMKVMAEAKVTGNTGAAFQQVTRILYAQFAAAVNDLSRAYSFIGVDKATWEAMKDDEREEAVLNSGTEAIDNGILSKDAFGEIVKICLEKNVAAAIDEDEKVIPKNKINAILDEIYGVMTLTRRGYLTAQKEQELIDQVRENSLVKKILKTYEGDEYLLKDDFSGTRLEAIKKLIGTTGS